MYAEQTDDNTFSDALHTLERWAENAQLAGVSRAYNHVHPGSNTRPFEQNFSWYRERIAAVPENLKKYESNPAHAFLAAEAAWLNEEYEANGVTSAEQLVVFCRK